MEKKGEAIGGRGGKAGRRGSPARVTTATKIAVMEVRRYEPERSADSVSSAHAGRGQRAKCEGKAGIRGF